MRWQGSSDDLDATIDYCSGRELRHTARLTTAEARTRAREMLSYFGGSLDDVPVATAELAVGGGVVGLYNISTRETHRRRGFGSRLTLQPLLDARALGYHTAVRQAAAEGVGIYQRLSFRRFGDITEYKPHEESADNVLG